MMKIHSHIDKRLPLLAIAALMIGAPYFQHVVHAEPYNEDEWYDPTDWFDGNNREADETYQYRGLDQNDYVADDVWLDRSRNTYPYWADDDQYSTDWSDGNGYTGSNYSRGTYWRDTYDYGSSSQNIQSDLSQSSSQKSTQQNRQRIISGYIDGFREVNLRNRQGGSDPFTVVRIRLRDGSSATVDLGKRLSLRDVNLENGDYIRVKGEQRRISGQDVILADLIYADGEQHRIQRDGSSTGNRSESSQRQTSQNSQFGRDNTPESASGVKVATSLKGTVDSFMRVNVPGSRSGHTLVKLKLEDGRSKIVDLGPYQWPSSLGISAGNEVTIRGNEIQLNGKPILRVESIFADGQWTSIHRHDSTRQDSQQSSQTKGTGSQAMQQGLGSDSQSNAQSAQTQNRQQDGDRESGSFTLSGTVQSMHLVNAEGSKATHTLAKLMLTNGQSEIVDLGPNENLRTLRINVGDTISIRGTRTQWNGKDLLRANSVYVEGTWKNIQRTVQAAYNQP